MTAIQWTNRTWNPTTGCDRVSSGCDNCYALTMAKRLKGMGQEKYRRDGDPRTSGPGFGLTIHPDMISAPLRWRKPSLVFVNSMSDLFHPKVPDEFIAAVWCTMSWTSVNTMPGLPARPVHTYQILTKRPQRMRSWVRKWGDRDCRTAWIAAAWERGWCDVDDREHVPWFDAALRNVWLGVSAENQEEADRRIPYLMDTPAVVRFISAEPLLGPINLRWQDGVNGMKPANWVIVGGESGPGARPMDIEWVRSLRDQCRLAGTPIFVKQMGSAIGPGKGGDPDLWPEDLRIRQFPGVQR